MTQVPNFFEKPAGVIDTIGNVASGIYNTGSAVGRGAVDLGGRVLNSVGTFGNQLGKAYDNRDIKLNPMPDDMATARENAASNESMSTALNWFLGAGAAGAGLAGLGAIVRRWRKPTKKEEIDELRKRMGPILSLSRATGTRKAATIGEGASAPAKPWRVPDQISGSDTSWGGPLAFSAATGGGFLGYLMLRKYLDAKEDSTLRNERIRAEQSFSKSITHALKPQGLRLTAKRASIAELTDEEVVMSALDDIAREKVAEIKRASILGKIGWWTALGLLPAAGLGAHLGWSFGSAKNPYTKELRDIKTRQLLQAVNAPGSPILTTSNIDNLQSESDEEDEEQDDELLDDELL